MLLLILIGLASIIGLVIFSKIIKIDRGSSKGSTVKKEKCNDYSNLSSTIGKNGMTYKVFISSENSNASINVIRLDISDIDQIEFRNPISSGKKLITSLMYVLNK